MGNDVNYLYEPEGSELHWDGLQKAQPQNSGLTASLSGPGPKFSSPKPAEQHPDDRQGMMNTARSDGTPRPAQAVRPLSNEELMAKANEMLDNQRAQTQGNLSQGPSTGARDDAGGQLPEWLSRYMDQGT